MADGAMACGGLWTGYSASGPAYRSFGRVEQVHVCGRAWPLQIEKGRLI